MVGIPWEGHVAFLDAGRERSIERRVRDAVAQCRDHPGVVYSIGNEIPANLVRWQGIRRTERFLERLAGTVKDSDAAALVTYANYPTTEYSSFRLSISSRSTSSSRATSILPPTSGDFKTSRADGH